jgi:plasmid stabilization system protein ParE
MNVKFTREAHEDLTAILSYIHQRNPSGAKHVLHAVDGALELLSEHPESGRATDNASVRVTLVPRYPYKIFYRLIAGNIEVFHIRHAARRPWENE